MLFLGPSVSAEYDFQALKQPVLKYLREGALVQAIANSQCMNQKAEKPSVLVDIIDDISNSLGPEDIPQFEKLLASDYLAGVLKAYEAKVSAIVDTEIKDTGSSVEVCDELKEMAALTLAESLLAWKSVERDYGYK